VSQFGIEHFLGSMGKQCTKTVYFAHEQQQTVYGMIIHKLVRLYIHCIVYGIERSRTGYYKRIVVLPFQLTSTVNKLYCISLVP